MAPSFIIIGAQKAASTYLVQCLADHPDIYMYRQEIPFFEDPDYEQERLPQFLQLFDKAQGEKAVGFKRPSYLAKPECPRRLHTHFPDAKLIAVLRNPIDRAVSAYFHYMQNGFIPIEPLNEGMQSVIDGDHAGEYPAGRDIVEYGFYAKQLQRYLADFKREQLLVVLYDDIKIAPEKVLRKVYGFLGVVDDYRPRSVSAKPMASIKSPARLRMNVFLRRSWTKHNDDRTRMYHRPSLISQAMRLGCTGLDRYVLAKLFSDNKPELAPGIRRRLAEIYADDVRALEGLTGRNLSHWLELPAAGLR